MLPYPLCSTFAAAATSRGLEKQCWKSLQNHRGDFFRSDFCRLFSASHVSRFMYAKSSTVKAGPVKWWTSQVLAGKKHLFKQFWNIWISPQVLKKIQSTCPVATESRSLNTGATNSVDNLMELPWALWWSSESTRGIVYVYACPLRCDFHQTNTTEDLVHN